jgi:hypothetical protein
MSGDVDVFSKYKEIEAILLSQFGPPDKSTSNFLGVHFKMQYQNLLHHHD